LGKGEFKGKSNGKNKSEMRGSLHSRVALGRDDGNVLVVREADSFAALRNDKRKAKAKCGDSGLSGQNDKRKFFLLFIFGLWWGWG
jgi:hypothetical protein